MPSRTSERTDFEPAPIVWRGRRYKTWNGFERRARPRNGHVTAELHHWGDGTHGNVDTKWGLHNFASYSLRLQADGVWLVGDSPICAMVMD